MSGVILVTGASRGIGAATARLAAARGYDVAINYRSAREAAEEVAAAAAAHGVRTCLVQADVGREAEVLRLFETVDRELGTLTALVNNAGIVGGASKVVDLDASTLERTLAANVIGPFLCAREAIRRMARSRGGVGGAIVNVSSIAARLGNAGLWVHYAASKGAMHTFTWGLAQEVGGDGIRVNAVAPGIIDTEIHEPGGGRARFEQVLPAIPLQRIGTADEVAEAILWLLSDAASYITGAVVDIGGGR